jgi:hypothetical protein
VPRILLDLALETLQEALNGAKSALTDAYAEVQTAAGKALNASYRDNLLFPLSEFYGRLRMFFQGQIVVAASEATPMGATGANLDRWLELKGAVVPAAQLAQVEIDVTGGNSAVLPAGWDVANINGDRYSTDAPLAFPAGSATLTVSMTAEIVGSLANVGVGDVVTLEPFADVVSAATVSAVLVAGADPADEDAKGELLDASFAGDAGSGAEGWYVLALKQRDGAIGDVLSVPAGFGPGSLVLYPLLALTADELATTPWLLKLPSSGQAGAWETAIRERRTVNDRIYVEVLATPEIDIDATITPDNASTQAAATEALRLRFAQSYSAGGYSIANSEILGAITTATGIASAVLTSVTAGTGATVDNVPAPGPGATVYSLLGQALLSNLSFS